MNALTDNATSTKEKKMNIKVGEIFEYQIQNEEEIDTVKAFFVRVGRQYFLINIDSDDNSFGFFDQIVGMNYKGEIREGKHPFNYKECLEYFKMKKVKTTGKFVIEPPKSAIHKTKSNFLNSKDMLDNDISGYYVDEVININ